MGHLTRSQKSSDFLNSTSIHLNSWIGAREILSVLKKNKVADIALLMQHQYNILTK